MLALAENFVITEGVVAVARLGGVVEPGGDREGARQIQVPAVGDEHAALLGSVHQVSSVRVDLDGLSELAGLAGPGEGGHLAVEPRVARGIGNFAKGVHGVHVPDAEVVRPDLRRAGGHVRLGFAVGDRETPAVLEDRDLHPEERLPAGVPRVDLVGEDRAVLVRDLEVRTVARRRVIEAGDERLGDPQRDRNVRRGRPRIVHRRGEPVDLGGGGHGEKRQRGADRSRDRASIPVEEKAGKVHGPGKKG